MKKLMVAVAIATSIGMAKAAPATGFTSTGFETYATGALDTTKDDAGNTDGHTDFAATWVALPAENDNESKILAYDGEGAEATPSKFSSVVETKYLHVETGTNKVERNVQHGGSAVTVSEAIYLDTLVKFTASEELFKDGDLAEGDKIAISYVGQPDGDLISNIVVRAGFVTGDENTTTITETNYVMSGTVAINPDNWYRLTVRAIATGYDAAPLGFAIYIDGNLFGYNVAQAAGDNSAYLTALNNNSTIKEYLYNGSTHALLPSRVRGAAENSDSLTAVGFKGTGCIDNIAFSDTKPAGLPDEGILITIESLEGVSAVAVTVGEDEITGDNGVYTLPTGTTTFNLAVTWDTANDYTSGTITQGERTISAGSVDVSDGTTITLKGNRNNFEFVDGNNVSVTASTLTDALDRVGDGKTITLAHSYNVTTEGEDTVYELSRKAVTLDLHGETITGGANSEDALFTVNEGATLTVIDTVGGGKIEDTTVYGIFLPYGDIIIGSADAADMGVTVDGILVAPDETGSDLIVVRGKFDEDSNTAEGAFKWTVDEGSSCSATPADGYWVVAPGQAPVEPTCWADVLGDAAQDGAYEIDDLAELKDFQKYVGAVSDGKFATAGLTFRLTANITLDEPWPGIGVQNGKDIYTTADFEAAAFQGTFDGQNHTISGFQMVGGGLDYCGFFNSTYGATIQNLKIQYAGSLFAVDTAANSSTESGATFVGVAKNSTLRNLTTLAGTVSCDKGFGGIVGYLTSGTLVDSCTNNVNMTSLKPNKCGGIAMITQGGSAVTIQNCQNNGSVAGSGEIGGLVGYIGLDTTITDCESTTPYKLFQHQGSTVTLSGVKGNATVESYTGAATPGLNFATVDGNVATFVADGALAAGNTYKVMHTATANYEFTAAGTISFDTNLVQAVTFAVTAQQGSDLEVTDATENGVVTFTAAVPGPVTPTIDPASETATVEVTAASAEDAIAAVAVTAPANAGIDTPEEIAAYKALFNITANETSAGSGVFTVEVTGIKETVEDAVEESAMDVLDGKLGAKVQVPAGLYYKVTTFTELGGTAVDTQSNLSDGTGVSVTKPGETQGFIKIEMATKAIN